ncbi:unnamed protein product [Peniophora sp. CBMAI 1063]|nr:unnamed protein product [Peniophora sp. CBMAI 1063]
MHTVDIVDVRVNDKAANGQLDMRQEILDGLSKPQGEKNLPTLLLYDERGLRIYDEITTDAEEYYLFGAEERILKEHADEIVGVMNARPDGSSVPNGVVLELGAGALRKTSHVLRALARAVPEKQDTPPVFYYALDLEKNELQRTLGELAESDLGPELSGRVSTKGMWGTYDGGLKFVQEGGFRGRGAADSLAARARSLSAESGSDALSGSITSLSRASEDTAPSTPGAAALDEPMHVMFLGSSLGNFPRGADAEFLRSLPLRAGTGDTLLLGMDHGRNKAQIEAAYNDRHGITARFILNGLKGAGRTLGDEALFDGAFEYSARYNEELRRHEAFYRSPRNQTIRVPGTEQELTFAEGELISVEVSCKYSEEDAWKVFSDANLRPIQRWVDAETGYALWLLERPPFSFPRFQPTALSSSPFGCPSFQDFQDMWALWDFVTRRMIPDSMLLQKPIDLRHICLFYTGHIPTFLDIHLSKLLKEPHTEPDGYKYIFERGIDPIVDNPDQVHPHSEVPTKDEDWPKLVDILEFQSRVRARLRALYDDIESGKRPLTRRIARVLMLTLEHEGFHAETLLYMLLQRAGTGTVAPSLSGFHPPPWKSLADSWETAPKPTTPTVTLGPAEVYLGHDDAEAADGEQLYDRKSEVGWDNEHPRRAVQVGAFRIEWRPVTNGEFFEFWRMRKGEIGMPKSWVGNPDDEKTICVRTLEGPVPFKVAYEWPVLTDYVSLSTYASVKGGRIPTEPELRLFYDKFECGFEGGRNVAFRNWHPVPATTGVAGGGKDGRGHNGGVWEWTSTVFDNYEGFQPMSLYPGYSTDFFDGLHNAVIGGSYATVPRLSERRSLVNYYQRIYPYAWIGARIAYDA